jgi:hypothetical protein
MKKHKRRISSKQKVALRYYINSRIKFSKQRYTNYRKKVSRKYNVTHIKIKKKQKKLKDDLVKERIKALQSIYKFRRGYARVDRKLRLRKT